MAKTGNSKTKTIKSTNVAKKNTKSTNRKETQMVSVSATDELRKLSILLISIVGIICIFYIITMFVTKKNQALHYQLNNEISQISYTDILASDILKKDGTYYVLVKDNNDPYVSLYKTYIESYISSEEHLDVYSVDLNDALNQKYKAEQSNLPVDALKFKGTTLLKISNHVIETSYEDSASINEHLKSLVTK